MGMETYLKKFGEPTKCSSNDCRTMITEAHNDRLLCDSCYEIWKRNFRIALLADFGYVSPYLSSEGFGDLPKPSRRWTCADYDDI